MGSRIAHQVKSTVHRAPPARFFDMGDPIPVPDVLEEDTDASWELWQQASRDFDFDDRDTLPMDLN